MIRLNRTQIAVRSYRLTGQGIYMDSVAVNAPSPIEDAILGPAVITGQDGGTPAVYKGLAYWFWSDTNCARWVLITRTLTLKPNLTLTTNTPSLTVTLTALGLAILWGWKGQLE